MNGWEIALLVGLCVLFVAAVAFIIYNKVSGKSGCDCCDCGKTRKNGEDGKGKSHCDGHCAMCLGLHAQDGNSLTNGENSDGK